MPEGKPHYLQEELYERIQSNPELFNFLREASLDGLWYWDLESPENEWMDDRFWEILGVDPATKKQKTSEWQDLIHPEDLELAIQNFNQHCEDPSFPYDQIVRYKHQDGSTVWVRCRGIAIRNQEGKPVRMLGAHNELTELKQKELELLKANQIADKDFSAIWEDSPVMHVHVDPETAVVQKCNWNVVKRLGYSSKEDIEGKPVLEVYHQDCIEEAEKAFQSFSQTGKVEHAELLLKTKEGQPVPVILNVTSIKDEEGRTLHSSSTWVEITELRKTQESERFSSFALEHAAVSFYLVAPDARILRVNKATCENTGFSKEELESWTIHDINPDFPKEAWAPHWEELRQKGFLRFESRILKKDGTTYAAEIETNYVEFEGKAYNFAFVRDITELKEAQQSQRLMDFAVKHATVAFFMIDPEANLLQVNEYTSEQTGWSEDELLGMTVFDVDPEFPREAWPEHWAELKEKKFLRFESTQRRKDGTTFPTEIETNFVEFEGKAYNFAFVRDITDRKERIRQRDLTEAKLEALVEERTKDLVAQRRAALNLAMDAEAALKRAEAAEKKLAPIASKLALPRKGISTSAAPFHLDRLTLKDVMMCGGMIRGTSQHYQSLESYLESIPRFFLDNFFTEDDQPAFGLIQVHLCKPFSQLTTEQQESAQAKMPGILDDTACLVLQSSSSRIPGSESIRPFKQVWPAKDLGIHKTAPHLGNMLFQFGEGIGQIDHEGAINQHGGIAALHVKKKDSPNWPEARLDELPTHHVQNILSFGQRLSEEKCFILTAFSNAQVSVEDASRFAYLAHSVRLGILQFLGGKNSTQNQIQAVDALLAGHEAFATDQEEHLRETMSALTKANNELQHSNEELDKFAFAASHDLKSPLFAIQNLIYMIEEDVGDVLPEEGWHLFNKVKKRLGQMEELLQSMLQYSRVGLVEDSPEEQDINELLQSIISLLDPPPGTTVEIQPNLPKLKAPRGALLRVFSNLLSNAIKHGGKEELTIRVTYQDNEKEHSFTIADDGIGIAEKHHARVFHLFKTLEPKASKSSSGMGLSLVKKTIEHYGGKIRIDSTPGSGTYFTVTWPK